MTRAGFLWHAVLTGRGLNVEKGLKDTAWPLAPEQRVNAARDTVRGGKGRTGAVGEKMRGMKSL